MTTIEEVSVKWQDHWTNADAFESQLALASAKPVDAPAKRGLGLGRRLAAASRGAAFTQWGVAS